MRNQTYLLVLLSLFLVTAASGQDAGVADAAKVAVDAGTAAVPAVDAGGSIAEVVETGKAVVVAAKEGKPEGMPSLVWWGMLIAVAGKFLLSLLRKFGYLLGKQTMRLAWLAIGTLVGVGTSLGAGLPWYEAAYLGVSAGPGSMIAHEVLKLINPAKWTKDKTLKTLEDAKA